MRLCNISDTPFSLEEVVESFISSKRAQGVTLRTLTDYSKFFEKFISFSHNSMDIVQLSSDALNYLASIPHTSPARYNHPYQYLSAFFNWCVRQNILPHNPLILNGISKKRDDGNVAPAPIEHIHALIKVADRKTYTGLRNYTIILLMIDTGVRTSELVRLKNSDFDQSSKSLVIRKSVAKTRTQRIVYLSEKVCSVLSRFIRIKPQAWSDYLFPSRDGLHLSTNALSREFRKLSAAAGVKVTPYQLRHSFATYFVSQGGNIFALQNLMGHSDIRMTKRYTELSDVIKKEEHDKHTPLLLIEKNIRLINL